MGKLADALRGASLSQQHRAQVVALDREFVELQLENETLKMQKLTLEAEVNPMKREMQRLKERLQEKPPTNQSDGLTFNTSTGTYVDAATGMHYCTKCLAADKRQPLQNDKYGWKCAVCNKRYRDPSAPLPRVVTDGHGGPNGWMR